MIGFDLAGAAAPVPGNCVAIVTLLAWLIDDAITATGRRRTLVGRTTGTSPTTPGPQVESGITASSSGSRTTAATNIAPQNLWSGARGTRTTAELISRRQKQNDNGKKVLGMQHDFSRRD